MSEFTVPESYADRGSGVLRGMVPLRGRAIVEVEPEPASRILWFPQHEGRKSTHEPHFGRVVRLGPPALSKGGTPVPWQCSEGDRVLFGKYSGTKLVLRGEEVRLMREEELLLVIK